MSARTRSWQRCAIFVGSLLALLLAPDVLDAEYRAGVAKVDITPSHPIRLNGFGFRRAESEGVYQKLWAKALAIDTGDGAPAILTFASGARIKTVFVVSAGAGPPTPPAGAAR